MPMLPPPPPRTASPRPLHLVADAVPQHAPEYPAQGDVSHPRARKTGGIGGVPAVQRPLRPGEGQHQALVGLAEASGMGCPPPQPGGRNQNPLPPAPSTATSFTSSMSSAAFSFFPSLPPAASFFFFFSSLFFSFFLFFSSFFSSFFLLFLSCSEESVDSSLAESAAGREAQAG